VRAVPGASSAPEPGKHVRECPVAMPLGSIHPAKIADQVCFRVADGLRAHFLASLSTA
jgi:hypothetical protein